MTNERRASLRAPEALVPSENSSLAAGRERREDVRCGRLPWRAEFSARVGPVVRQANSAGFTVWHASRTTSAPEVESGRHSADCPDGDAWSGAAASGPEQPRSEATARWTSDRTPSLQSTPTRTCGYVTGAVVVQVGSVGATAAVGLVRRRAVWTGSPWWLSCTRMGTLCAQRRAECAAASATSRRHGARVSGPPG